MEYETILAEEQPQLCAQYGIMQAPTLIEEAGGKCKFMGLPEILRYIQSRAVAVAK